MEEIKPCPFCGNIDIEVFFQDAAGVQCINCEALIFGHGSEEKAIQAWNKRKANKKYKKMWEHLKATYKQVICPPKTGDLEVMRLIEERYK